MKKYISFRSDLIRSYIFMFSLGAVIYPCFEILYRGYTHFTMVILGGISAVFIHRINRSLTDAAIPIKALLCAFAITALEFVFGVIFNVFLKMKIWDYSSMAIHVLGQISPVFSFIWFVLSLVGIYISTLVDRHITPCLNGKMFFYEGRKDGKT